MRPVRIVVASAIVTIALLASTAHPSVAAPTGAESPAVAELPAVAEPPAVAGPPALAGSPPAEAPDRTPAEARLLYEEGLARYRAGDYAGAITKLEASYAKVAAPGLLYDLAQAHRLNADCRRAIDHYRRFLASGPTGLLRDRTLARIAEMDLCVTALPAPAPLPVPTPLSTTAGPLVLAPREPTAVPPTARTGGAITIATPTHETDTVFDHLRRHRLAAAAGGATTLGFAALAGYFAWRTNDASNDVSSTFRPGSQSDANGSAAEQRGQTSFKLELGSALGALIAAGVSAWLVFRD